MNARLEGLNLWDRDVARYLDSDRIPVFNPIEDFLFGVDIRWDGRDRIRELASRVPCNNIHWPDLFYRWFLNMVAHWRHTDRNYANCTVPLLVGPQAYRKSTFCRNLLPTELQPYYTDRIDFSNKRDAELPKVESFESCVHGDAVARAVGDRAEAKTERVSFAIFGDGCHRVVTKLVSALHKFFCPEDTLSALFEVALNKAYRSLSELHPNVHLHSDDDLKPSSMA